MAGLLRLGYNCQCPLCKGESMPDKVVIGVPSIGSQNPEWWVRLSVLCSQFAKEGIELRGILNANGVMVDANRNLIVDIFLQNNADWLFWIDSDTRLTYGAARTLIDSGKTMTSGLYFAKSDLAHPIAYVRSETGYEPLTAWEKGELREVDGAGLGCCMTHRTVYEDIQKQWARFRLHGGGETLVHVNDIRGNVTDGARHKDDRMLINGQLHSRLLPVPERTTAKYPFFVLEHCRTEDFWFFEKAQRAGHKLFLDTLVECDHYGSKAYSGEDYRERLEGWAIVHKPGLITQITDKPIDLWEAFREE